MVIKSPTLSSKMANPLTAAVISALPRAQKLALVAQAAKDEQARRQTDANPNAAPPQDGSRIVLLRGWRGEPLRYRLSADDLNL